MTDYKLVMQRPGAEGYMELHGSGDEAREDMIWLRDMVDMTGGYAVLTKSVEEEL